MRRFYSNVLYFPCHNVFRLSPGTVAWDCCVKVCIVAYDLMCYHGPCIHVSISGVVSEHLFKHINVFLHAYLGAAHFRPYNVCSPI